MQKAMFGKAKKFLKENTVEVKEKKSFQQAIKERKMVLGFFCHKESCEELIKEETGASFGGRILMDDAELEGMQEYRLNTVRDAIRGAEFSLEFKTN